jgi:hypothetical protein
MVLTSLRMGSTSHKSSCHQLQVMLLTPFLLTTFSIIKSLTDFASTKSLSDLIKDFFSFISATLEKCKILLN